MLDPYAVTGTSPPRKGGLRIVQTQGLFVPRILCDSCGEQISDGRGSLVFDRDVEVAMPLFAHQGACELRLAIGRSRSSDWMRFGTALLRMIADSEVDLAAAIRRDAAEKGLR